MSKARYYIPL